MELKLTREQMRHLLDLVYIGNWVINSIRGDDRITQYDEVESTVFKQSEIFGLKGLVEHMPEPVPSQRYVDGGIHEAIMDYEDMVFYNILAEELARRDLRDSCPPAEYTEELEALIDSYMNEFSLNGIENVVVE